MSGLSARTVKLIPGAGPVGAGVSPWGTGAAPPRPPSRAAKSPSGAVPEGGEVAPLAGTAAPGARICAMSKLKADEPGRMNLPVKGRLLRRNTSPLASQPLRQVCPIDLRYGKTEENVVHLTDPIALQCGFCRASSPQPGRVLPPSRLRRRLARAPVPAGLRLASKSVSQSGCRIRRVEMKGFFRKPCAGAAY